MSSRKVGRLTPHFHVREFDCHDGTLVPLVAVPGLLRLATTVLEPLRREFGACRVVSGYRHERYNARIGGAPDSRHIYDRHPVSPAADLVFARGTPREWAAAAERLPVGGLGRYATFVHVDRRGSRARW